MRDNNHSPHPTENPTAPLMQADPSTPSRRESNAEDPTSPSPSPSTLDPQHTNQSLPRSKPLFRGFESPSLSRVAILAVLCFITYPAFYILALVAKDKSLFTVRLAVSVWCSAVGFALGYILLKIGGQHLEAASEFILVGCRDFLSFTLNSLGHRGSHEPRRWRNETPRSGQKLKQSNELYARLPYLPVSSRESRDFQAFA